MADPSSCAATTRTAGHGSAGHVYLHGGGWTSGSIRELVCDATARHRTASASCVTCLVEYRLAPEHRFPTAVHGVVSVVRWVVDRAIELQIDPQRITLGGTAGANLAVAAVLAAPDPPAPRAAARGARARPP